RNQACADCGYGLGASGCVGFAMVRTTFGVTDDDEGGANVLQHFCRDVTRVRAKWPFMARLPPIATGVRAQHEEAAAIKVAGGQISRSLVDAAPSFTVTHIAEISARPLLRPCIFQLSATSG